MLYTFKVKVPQFSFSSWPLYQTLNFILENTIYFRLIFYTNVPASKVSPPPLFSSGIKPLCLSRPSVPGASTICLAFLIRQTTCLSIFLYTCLSFSLLSLRKFSLTSLYFTLRKSAWKLTRWSPNINFEILSKCPISRSEAVKGKAIPVHPWTGPESSCRLRLPDFKTIGTRMW